MARGPARSAMALIGADRNVARVRWRVDLKAPSSTPCRSQARCYGAASLNLWSLGSTPAATCAPPGMLLSRNPGEFLRKQRVQQHLCLVFLHQHVRERSAQLSQAAIAEEQL